MTMRSRGRRHALAGAGAAALTAAAVFVGPAASAAPSDQIEQAAEAVQEEAEEAVEEAEAALEEAQEQAEEATGEAREEAQEAVDEAEAAVEDARQQAEQALEEAQQQADEAQESAGDVFGDLPRVSPGDWLPDDLREDLESLQQTPASERTERLQEIIDAATDGDYGDEVQRWSQRMGGLLASLPQELRQDIQQVIGQEPEEARADVRQIVEDAVDGEYGEDVEQWADWLRDTAQRWDLARSIQGVGPTGDDGN
ncbi:hypothetical protein [Blastococcus litoris]|uniref:hypothetical protein n=1 Tax=Blastococcus litoris TaxID=2171622 RepID=UPI0013E0066C|nr:hypothetical protein [Blastococcus litoris]